jgi:hypothetical protein
VSGIGRGGTSMPKVGRKEVARQRIEHSMPLIMEWGENFEVGADTGQPSTTSICRDAWRGVILRTNDRRTRVHAREIKAIHQTGTPAER